MKRKNTGIILMTVMLTLTGCGAQATNVQATSTNNVAEVSAVTESVNTPIESTVIEETSSIVESEVEPIYTEYEDLFLAENFSKLNRERLEAVDEDNIEKTYEKFVLSESVDLYNFEGTWNGYSKPNIKVTLFGTTEDWEEVSFSTTILYIPKTDFDRVAVKVEDTLLATTPVQETTPVTKTPATDTEKPVAEKPKTETPASAISKPVTEEPATVSSEPIVTEPSTEPETPVVDNTKYTPEEAVAVYRSIMESNGIEWDPSIKEFASWGTGWIYLTKGWIDKNAYSAVESYKMGSNGKPWTKYYIEITGADENAVYITEWNCD